jgi:hypothetical protein
MQGRECGYLHRLRIRKGSISETLDKMLLKSANLNFFSQSSKSMPKEIMSECSRRKCHFTLGLGER